MSKVVHQTRVQERTWIAKTTETQDHGSKYVTKLFSPWGPFFWPLQGKYQESRRRLESTGAISNRGTINWRRRQSQIRQTSTMASPRWQSRANAREGAISAKRQGGAVRRVLR